MRRVIKSECLGVGKRENVWLASQGEKPDTPQSAKVLRSSHRAANLECLNKLASVGSMGKRTTGMDSFSPTTESLVRKYAGTPRDAVVNAFIETGDVDATARLHHLQKVPRFTRSKVQIPRRYKSAELRWKRLCLVAFEVFLVGPAVSVGATRSVHQQCTFPCIPRWSGSPRK